MLHACYCRHTLAGSIAPPIEVLLFHAIGRYVVADRSIRGKVYALSLHVDALLDLRVFPAQHPILYTSQPDIERPDLPENDLAERTVGSDKALGPFQ